MHLENLHNTEVTITLPKDLRGYFTSKFKTDKIEKIIRQHTKDLDRNFK